MNPAGVIVIPVHNRREQTLACLAALAAQGDLGRFRVRVVDDGSTDGTAEAIRRDFPSVELLAGTGELYWTGAIRLAMGSLLASDFAGTVFWLNDDVRPAPGALSTLANWLAAHPAALAGPACVDANGGQTVPTGFVGRRVIRPGGDAPIAVDGLSGFCIGLGPEAWRALGAPDADAFPHYGGDTAYTLRARHRGHAVVLLPQAVVTLIDHDAARGTLAGRIDPSLSLSENWHALFRATRSPFRLRTARALLRLKYGAFAGSLLGAMRTVVWTAALGLAWLQRRRS